MLLINFVLVVSLATSAVYGGSAQSSYKARRGGTVGLFPFPRVGRSQIGHSWQISPLELGDLHSEVKRQGLIPFPRVGRSDHSEDITRMWFGPRLGRDSKRAPYLDDNAWTMFALREMPQRDIAARLMRESEELSEDNETEQSEIEPDANRTV